MRIASEAMVNTHPDPTASNLKVNYGTWGFCYSPSRMHVAAGVTDIVNSTEIGVNCLKYP